MQPILVVLVACLVYIVVFVGVSWAKDKFNDWSDNDDKDDWKKVHSYQLRQEWQRHWRFVKSKDW